MGNIYVQLVLWALCVLLSELYGHTISVTESIEDIPNNVTSLHPVSTLNHTNHFNVQPLNNDDSRIANKNSKLKSEATVWKIETVFAEPKLPKQGDEKKEDNGTEDSKEEATIERPENNTNEFKPSLHLEDFFDLDDVLPPTKEIDQFNPIFQQPQFGFKGYPKDPRKNPNDFPKFSNFPNKLDSPIYAKSKDNWKLNNLDTKLPAGGLYKYQDPFKDKPSIGFGDDDNGGDFEMEFNGDFRETAVKKRMNPWKHVLHSLAAILPVGLIIAALTPNIITIENTGPTTPNLNRYTRSVETLPPHTSPPISERCRRRLLCELYTDRHYVQSPSHKFDLSSNCAVYRCNDSRTLTKLLTWMIRSHSRPKGTKSNII